MKYRVFSDPKVDAAVSNACWSFEDKEGFKPNCFILNSEVYFLFLREGFISVHDDEETLAVPGYSHIEIVKQADVPFGKYSHRVEERTSRMEKPLVLARKVRGLFGVRFQRISAYTLSNVLED